MAETYLSTHRNNGKKAGLVFVHGFMGDPKQTWGEFPSLISGDSRLSEWDIYSFGYSTRLRLDLVGLWSADPPLQSLADLLRTAVANRPLDRYKALGLVAHSMGGLVVQRAILDDEGFRGRLSHVFLFGTPSGGLVKASLFTSLKRQLRDMAADGQFIGGLRKTWDHEFNATLPFKFTAVAGDRDEFVPRESSIDPFPENQRAMVPGNHLQIVKPEGTDSLSFQVLAKGIIGDAAPAGPWNSANVAVESRDFRRAIEILEPHKSEIDAQALVQLALALEGLGRREDAIRLLEERQGRTGTDAMGVLAGRLKRRWLLERQAKDADAAKELYTKAYGLTGPAGNDAQAFYHGVNIAFMQLAYDSDLNAAKQTAEKVLVHCARASREKWRLATEGEANLYLGNTQAALDNYQAAVALNPNPWEIASMYQQAVLVLGLLDDENTAKRLDEIFRGDAR